MYMMFTISPHNLSLCSRDYGSNRINATPASTDDPVLVVNWTFDTIPAGPHLHIVIHHSARDSLKFKVAPKLSLPIAKNLLFVVLFGSGNRIPISLPFENLKCV